MYKAKCLNNSFIAMGSEFKFYPQSTLNSANSEFFVSTWPGHELNEPPDDDLEFDFVINDNNNNTGLAFALTKEQGETLFWWLKYHLGK